MSDFKSKLPDLKELASMTSKLYTDIKKSVGEIVHSYKETRTQHTEEVQPAQDSKPRTNVDQEASSIKESNIDESKK